MQLSLKKELFLHSLFFQGSVYQFNEKTLKVWLSLHYICLVSNWESLMTAVYFQVLNN